MRTHVIRNPQPMSLLDALDGALKALDTAIESVARQRHANRALRVLDRLDRERQDWAEADAFIALHGPVVSTEPMRTC